MWLQRNVKPAFQSRMERELSETFRMFWEDSEVEDLVTYQVIESACSYHKQDTALPIIKYYYCPIFVEFLTIFQSENCRNYINSRMVTKTSRNPPKCFVIIRPIVLPTNG